MSPTATATGNAGKPKGSLLKKLAIAAGGLVALLVVAYWVATSAWFLKSMILPKAGKAMNATVTAEDATVSPFSGVKIAGLKVQTTGTEPLLAVREFSVRYPSLFDLIGGKIVLEEITLAGAQVNIIRNADGTSNLDALTKGQPSTTAQPPSGPSQPPQLYLKKLAISDSVVCYRQADKTGNLAAEVSGVNVTVEELGNGKTARLNLKSDLKFDQAVSGSATGAVQAGITGDFNLNLDAKLMPIAVNGGAEVSVAQASGAFKDAAALAAALKCDWTPTDLKGVSLQFSQSGKALASFSASGPFDATKLEGKLKTELTGVDRQLLGLVGAATGLDFNQTTLNAAGEIELAQGGKKIALNGGWKAARFSVTQQGQTTPEMDVQLTYNIAVDQPGQSALVQALSLTAVQKGSEVIRGALAKPMKIEWGKASGAVEESAFDLAVNNLNLADWRAFAPGLEPSGKLNLKLNLLSQNAGKILAVNLTSSLNDFAAKFGSNRIDHTDLTLAAKSATEGFAHTELSSFELSVAKQGQPVLKASGAGALNSTNLDADIRATAEVFLPRLGLLAGQTNLQFSQGSLVFQGNVHQKNLNPAQTNNPPFERAIKGDLQVRDLTGNYDAYVFDRFAVSAGCDIEVKNDLATIRKLAADLSQSGQAGGRVEVTGRYDLAKTNGQFALKMDGLNENFLKSFAALLAPNRLERVNLSAVLETAYDVKGDLSAKGSASVTDLLITDPQGQLPKTPMTAEAKLDLGLKNQVAEVRELNGSIKQGQLSGGSFDVKGRYDLAKTNGQFSVKVVDLNQNALRPFLAKSLGDLTLETISLNFIADTRFDAAGESVVSGELKLANLLVRDPKQQFPTEPQSAQLKLDGSFKQQVLTLRNLGLQLTPTARAANYVVLSGLVDMAKTNAIRGNLSLKADALDATYYYNLFANLPALAVSTNAPAQAASNEEPAPVTLPLTNFTFDAAIGRFFLRDIAVSNLTAALKIDGSRVNLSGLQASVNGAPAQGRLAADLSVPGYIYDVNFGLTRLPLAPVVASFMPYAKDGLKGDLSCALAVKGAGVTGKNLKNSLSGNFGLDLTNGTIIVKSLLKPDTTKKPAGVGAFVQVLMTILDPVLNAVGTAVGMPGLVAEPFDRSRLDMQFGGGNLGLRDFELSNTKIILGSRGAIPIADDLMASPLNLPLEVSLSRPLAARFSIANAPTNATHVKLPDFVAVKGTLAKAEPKLNTKALTGTALSEIGKRVGGDAGGILQGVGNLLGGGAKAVTNAPPAAPASTNKPSPNAPVNDLLDGLFGPKKK